MKTSILAVAIAACALSAPTVSAQETTTPAKPAMGMEVDKQMPKMQESMKKMQRQMENVRATTDPKERQKLMREHMLAMQENMKTMRGMGGPMMMGPGHRGGMAMGGSKEMADGDMMRRHEMMEKRMDMMQMMMEQMMQHGEIAESIPAK